MNENVDLSSTQSLRIPPSLQEIIDLGSITIRSKPFQDKEVTTLCMSIDSCNSLVPRLNACPQQKARNKASYEINLIRVLINLCVDKCMHILLHVRTCILIHACTYITLVLCLPGFACSKINRRASFPGF